MRIAIAADHGGFEFKRRLAEHVARLGHEVEDFGPSSLDPADDYPDYGIPAARAVSEGRCQRGILICNNGIGMCMLANRLPGVRGALVYNERTARDTRKHHDSNVLCLAGQEFREEELLRMVDAWLTEKFDGGRHARRMEKIKHLE